jgi:hypothetical protein
MSESIHIAGHIRGFMEVYELASAAIEKFPSKSPTIAPTALSKLYFLLKLLQADNVGVYAAPAELAALANKLRECRRVLKKYTTEPQGSGTVSNSWPAAAESELSSLIDEIDRELIQLSFTSPNTRRSWVANEGRSQELPSSQATHAGLPPTEPSRRKHWLEDLEVDAIITL